MRKTHPPTRRKTFSRRKSKWWREPGESFAKTTTECKLQFFCPSYTRDYCAAQQPKSHHFPYSLCLIYKVFQGDSPATTSQAFYDRKSDQVSNETPEFRRGESSLPVQHKEKPLLPPTPCPAKVEYATPVFARNYQGVWRYVVQIPYEGYFTQTIEVTRCLYVWPEYTFKYWNGNGTRNNINGLDCFVTETHGVTTWTEIVCLLPDGLVSWLRKFTTRTSTYQLNLHCNPPHGPDRITEILFLRRILRLCRISRTTSSTCKKERVSVILVRVPLRTNPRSRCIVTV